MLAGGDIGGEKTHNEKKIVQAVLVSIIHTVQLPLISYLKNNNAIFRSHPIESIFIWQSHK